MITKQNFVLSAHIPSTYQRIDQKKVIWKSPARSLDPPRRSLNIRSRKMRVVRAQNTVEHYEGNAKNAGNGDHSYAIVVAKFNSLVTKELLNGALKAFSEFTTTEIKVCWVPGSVEMPLVAKRLAESLEYSAIVCLGAVIRGGTYHYEAVVNAVTSGVLQATLTTNIPIVFGVLTCDTMEQALDRAGGKMGNKGYEAAITALEMSDLHQNLM